ncbi:F0F1 ATP synthase subunit delta, partial [Burkholderia multivorans]
ISGGNAREIGQSLLGVVGVLADNLGLRKALADSSEPAEKKQGLLQAVFGAQIPEAALRIASVAVSQRWARTQDFVTSLEVAGVTAIAAAAQEVGQ